MVWGTIPIGAFIGGLLGNSIGLRPTLWIGTIGLSLAFVPVALSPVRKLKEIPAGPEESDGAEGDLEIVAAPDLVPISQLAPLDAVVDLDGQDQGANAET
jgi:hypothetical protein